MGFWFVLISCLSHLKISTSKGAAQVYQRRTWQHTWHVLAWLPWPPSLLVTLQATYWMTWRGRAGFHGYYCPIISVICYIYARYVVCESRASRIQSAVQNLWDGQKEKVKYSMSNLCSRNCYNFSGKKMVKFSKLDRYKKAFQSNVNRLFADSPAA